MREIVMWQLQYRNEGDVQTLMGNLVTDVDHSDHAGIRWFELYRKGTHPWRLYQTGTLSPDEHHRWMGSIAKNGMGTIALGYSIASKSLYPSLRVTHRTAADPPGTLRTPEITLIKGSGAGTSNRWGDYSAMTVDPVDDCTFWYTSEFTRRDGTWDTRIGKLRFDACAGE